MTGSMLFCCFLLKRCFEVDEVKEFDRLLLELLETEFRDRLELRVELGILNCTAWNEGLVPRIQKSRCIPTTVKKKSWRRQTLKQRLNATRNRHVGWGLAVKIAMSCWVLFFSGNKNKVTVKIKSYISSELAACHTLKTVSVLFFLFFLVCFQIWTGVLRDPLLSEYGCHKRAVSCHCNLKFQENLFS